MKVTLETVVSDVLSVSVCVCVCCPLLTGVSDLLLFSAGCSCEFGNKTWPELIPSHAR